MVAKPPSQLQSLQQTLRQTLHDIEQESASHYKSNSSILSLTHSSFTQGTQSPEHERIKELVCSIHPLISEETALLFARDIFEKVYPKPPFAWGNAQVEVRWRGKAARACHVVQRQGYAWAKDVVSALSGEC